MKCKKCGKDLVLPERAYVNLETYNVGGFALAASECCNTGYVIKMDIRYKVTEYTGSRKEDDWGIKLRKA